MKISQAGLEAVKRHEGLRLFAYLDVAGVPTIGYGHTAGVREGQHINEAAAEQYLREDLAECETCVNNVVTVPMTQANFDALCSFAFNLGCGALKSSTLLQKLNARDYSGAADEFLRWNKAKVNGVLTPVDGLTRRRMAERTMFLSGTDPVVHLGPEPVAETVVPVAETPRPDQEPYVQPEARMPIPLIPIITALLPSVIEMLPKVKSLFGSGSKVSERNTQIVGAVLELAQKTTGAVNALDAVDRMRADPAVRAQVEAAVEQSWYALTEAGGGGIGGARAADVTVMNGDGPWWQVIKSPSFVIACLLMPLVYLIVGNVAGLYGAEWSTDARAGLSGSIAGGIVMGLIGYYFGQVTSKNRTPSP